jgi:acyl-CoA dehydrogenase
MDAARTLTCSAIDQGQRPSVISAIVKYQCTERMRLILNDGMDTVGGSGICIGPRNLFGRTYQALPISITVEGANILTRTLIIFGQGVIRCHPFVLNEMRAIGDPDRARGLAEFDRQMGGHVAFGLSTAARACFHGLTGGRLLRAPDGPGHPYYQAVSRYSAAFALTADVALLTLGGSLKRKEKLSGRMADILSHLYLVSAALKQFEDHGRPAGDLPLLRWSCETSLLKIQDSFDGLFRNLPSRPAAWLLRRLVFPTGRRLAGPSDALGHQAAALLLEPSAARDRLTHGIFTPMDGREPLKRMEETLRLVIAAEPVEKKLGAAAAARVIRPGSDGQMLLDGLSAGVITVEEGKLLREALEARREVVKVDDFPQVRQPRTKE